MPGRTTIIIGILLISTAASSPVYAYLDPGTGSILVQALVAAIAGIAVTLRIYWGQLRNLFSGKRRSAAKSSESSRQDR